MRWKIMNVCMYMYQNGKVWKNVLMVLVTSQTWTKMGNVNQRIMEINESLCKNGFFLMVDIISSGLSIVYIKGLSPRFSKKRELWMIRGKNRTPKNTRIKKGSHFTTVLWWFPRYIRPRYITVFQCKCETGSRPKYSKTCVKRPLKNRQNKDLNNNW